MRVRINRYIAMCNFASRRKAEEFILAGKVRINGKIAQLSDKVDPKKDIVEIEGRILKPVNYLYYIFNKPKGVVSTTKDEFGRKTVLDYVNSQVKLKIVGRLDMDSTGLMILTNDGEFIYKVTHPKNKVSKTYRVEVSGRVTPSQISALEKGVNIGGYVTGKAKVENVQRLGNKTSFEITLFEGKYHQVKRMCERVKLPFLYLQRIAIGGLRLGDLKQGEVRKIGREEIYRKVFGEKS